MTKKLKIIPLGGLNEIGRNMTVYEYGKGMILVHTPTRFLGSEAKMTAPLLSYP